MTRTGWLFVVALSLVACHRKQKASIKVTPLTGESAVLTRATPPATPPAVTVTPKSIQVADKTRQYLLVAPPAPAPDARLPLILVYHGDGGSMTSLHRDWKWETATGNDAFIAYPDGINAGWDLETKKGNRDAAFTLALVDELTKTLPIDKARVFGAGYSSGGFFVNVFACQHAGVFRGISSSAGGAPYNQEEKWPNGAPKCPGQQPTAIIALHGDRDFSVGLDSGRYSAEYWAHVNGCNETEVETTGYAECTAYKSCKAGAPVAWCPIHNLTHWVWDEAAAASWSFFRRL
ncbi:MAG: hypothetical protein KIT84_34340 [Labilithrix sp.]|nr:hypothetical protein [Labilithrix sp.]MCW5816127.1 hypothetical protein [Labilithrix sp.]